MPSRTGRVVAAQSADLRVARGSRSAGVTASTASRVEREQLGERGGVGHRAGRRSASSLTRTVGSCSSLSATRRTACATSSRTLGVELGQPGRRAGRARRRRRRSAIVRSATTVGVTLATARARRGTPATSSATIARTAATSAGDLAARRQLLGERGQVDQRDAGKLGDRRVDVVRAARGRRRRAAGARRRAGRATCGQRPTEHGAADRCRRRPRRPRPSSAARSVERDRRGRRTARPSRLRAWPACGWRPRRRRAPRRDRVAADSARHRAGADDQARAGRRAAPTYALGAVERDARPATARRGRCRSRCGRACRPAAPAGTSALRAGPTVPCSWPTRERLADLAEDLALADDHRVEPGGDREQVRDRAVVVVHVEVRHDVAPTRHAGQARTAARQIASTLPWNRSTSA